MDGDRLLTEPIAGTRPRGDIPEEDADLEADLVGDEKERAEHAMLVDLERNDLGKVSEYGTVDVADTMYEDGSPQTIEQYAKDIVAFLQWTSEPKLEERKSMGTFVMAYLFIFAGVTYASYRQIWRNVEK